MGHPQKVGIEEKIADILSEYIDSINNGEALSIPEILEKNSDIAEKLLPQLKDMENIYHRFLMKKAPEDFKEKLLKTLLLKMEAKASSAYEIAIAEILKKGKRHTVLRYLRERTRKSVEQVAKEAGIEREKVIALETNDKELVLPRVWTALARVYKIPIDKLGIILGKIPKWQSNSPSLKFATQYTGKDLTDEEKELINKFLQYKTGKKNDK